MALLLSGNANLDCNVARTLQQRHYKQRLKIHIQTKTLLSASISYSLPYGETAQSTDFAV